MPESRVTELNGVGVLAVSSCSRFLPAILCFFFTFFDKLHGRETWNAFPLLLLHDLKRHSQNSSILLIFPPDVFVTSCSFS